MNIRLSHTAPLHQWFPQVTEGKVAAKPNKEILRGLHCLMLPQTPVTVGNPILATFKMDI